MDVMQTLADDVVVPRAGEGRNRAPVFGVSPRLMPIQIVKRVPDVHMRRLCSYEFGRRDDLCRMPLRVLGRMKQQPEHGRRQAMASNLTRFVQRAERRAPNLVE